MHVPRHRSLLVLFAVALLALAACQGSADAQVQPTAQTYVEPVTMAAGFSVDQGTDQAAILEVWERQVAAVQRQDYDAFRADCHPDIQARVTSEQMSKVWAHVLGSNEPASLTVEIMEIRLYPGGVTANTTMNVSAGGRSIARETVRLNEKVGERWYYSGLGCAV